MNRQINTKNGNVHIGLVLAIFVLLMLVPIGTASWTLVYRDFVYNPWGGYWIYNYQDREYFGGYMQSSIIGTDIISAPDQLHNILLNNNNVVSSEIGDIKYLQEGYAFKVEVIDFNESHIDRKAVFLSLWKNGIEIDRYVARAGETYVYRKARIGNISDLPIILIYVDDIYQEATEKLVRFSGFFQISESISQIPAVTPTVTQTVTPTPIPTVTITPVQTTTVPTVIPTVTTTVIATVVPTVTSDTSPGHPDEYWERMREKYPPNETVSTKRATLEVTNKLDRSNSDIVVTVTLKNIGDDTARFVNFNSTIPAELGMTLLSGAERNGSELIWKGDIKAGEEHQIIYKIKPVKMDIEIPTKVTYVKDSGTANKLMANAAIEGMKAESISDSINPADLQTILLIIQIGKALPGFEMILGILGIGTIYILRRKNKT